MQTDENKPVSENGHEAPLTPETDIKAENATETDGKSANSQQAEEMDQKIKDLNDKYLRLYSEFDNYRKRTMKEKSEIIKSASEEVFKAILPVIDDFERAMKANENVEDLASIKEGMGLIFNKLKNASNKKGLTPFNSIGEVFNPDVMEAITHIPAQNDEQKGKVIDEIEKGYKLGEKVIRFAKVIVAQ